MISIFFFLLQHNQGNYLHNITNLIQAYTNLQKIEANISTNLFTPLSLKLKKESSFLMALMKFYNSSSLFITSIVETLQVNNTQ